LAAIFDESFAGSGERFHAPTASQPTRRVESCVAGDSIVGGAWCDLLLTLVRLCYKTLHPKYFRQPLPVTRYAKWALVVATGAGQPAIVTIVDFSSHGIAHRPRLRHQESRMTATQEHPMAGARASPPRDVIDQTGTQQRLTIILARRET
jgi:hypothetical protein